MKKSIKNLELKAIKNVKTVKGGKLKEFQIPEKVVMDKEDDFFG